MLYRLVEKNIKKNNKIEDFLATNLNIKSADWLFDDEYIKKHIYKMYVNYIIFQVNINNNYYFGKFNINILNYAIFDYQNRDENDDDFEKIIK